jgi:hypothetical protein
MGKKLRQFNRATHRDLGYFFVAMILIYSISGIAINHLDDWNPSYGLKTEEISFDKSQINPSLNKEQVIQLLEEWNIDNAYRKHYFPNDQTCKIFVKNGHIEMDLTSGKALVEIVNKRPILHTVNWLHYNPNTIWKWFSDIFALGLILLAISGMFILKGKNGLKWRGAILIGIGILIPLGFLFFFYF